MEQLRLKPASMFDAGTAGWGFNPLCHSAGLSRTFKIICISLSSLYLKGRERERESFILGFTLQMAPAGQAWARQKLGAWISILVFPVGGRGRSTCAITGSIPRGLVNRKWTQKPSNQVFKQALRSGMQASQAVF